MFNVVRGIDIYFFKFEMLIINFASNTYIVLEKYYSQIVRHTIYY